MKIEPIKWWNNRTKDNQEKMITFSITGIVAFCKFICGKIAGKKKE